MAAKTPDYLSPDWWSEKFAEAPQSPDYSEMMKAFTEWQARAGGNAHGALEKAIAAAREASEAREKTLRAFNKRAHSGAAKAIEAYDSVLKSRAAQQLKALENYKAQVDAVDAAAERTIQDATRMRKSMAAIKSSLDEAAAMTVEAMEAQSEKRVADAMKVSETLEQRTDAAIAIWENAMRELNAVFLGLPGDPSPAAEKPKAKKSKAKKKKAKKG